jgi:hypothetical protein
VTKPLEDTVATVALLVVQVTTRPVSGLPFAASGVADSCVVSPAVTLEVVGLTTTDATGTAVTVSDAVPLWPPLVAVIVAVPVRIPVTKPLPDTVATAPLLVAQVTALPVSAFPLASSGVAVSCAVCPTVTLDVVGLTTTEATGTPVTVTNAVPLWPSLVAVIVAAPAPIPVANPLADTVATAALLVAQVTTRPVKGFPLASLGVAVSWVVCPAVTFAVVGLTTTDATAIVVAVIEAVPLWPPLVAVIVAVPAAITVTKPLPDTVATDALLVAQVTALPVSAFPFASSGVAVSCAVCPNDTLAVAGLTTTEATGASATVSEAVPLWPPLVAVMDAAPGATAVTKPLEDTVATEALLVAQVTGEPIRGVPPEPSGVAVSWMVWPGTAVGAVGPTATDATAQ